MTSISEDIMKRGPIWRRFIINVSLIVVLFLMGIFVGFAIRTNGIINEQHLSTARAHFNNIVLTRRWNANHGGVFVEKREGVVSNPYLENPDIVASNGIVYTKKNPALMTREISEYAEKSGSFRYHITSLKPLNPGNKPDPFETRALTSFEKGQQETFAVFDEENTSTYRYMAPLPVEEGCIGCHGKQGYSVGDIRGGISVSFDITDVGRQMATNRYLFVGLGVAASVVLLGTLLFFVARLARTLSDAYSTIEQMSVTDELTRLFNRRHFHTRLEEEILRTGRYGRPLALLMADIDYFKSINDTYGHQGGDRILAEFAAILRSDLRKVDIVCRYGGEEFVIILPETGTEDAGMLAEKLRKRIQENDFGVTGEEATRITTSIGVASLDMVDANAPNRDEALIKLADEALYAAKSGGRNAVVIAKQA